MDLLLRFFHQVQLRLEGFVVEVWTVDQQIVGHILYEGSPAGGHIFRSHVQEAYQRVACQDMPPEPPQVDISLDEGATTKPTPESRIPRTSRMPGTHEGDVVLGD